MFAFLWMSRIARFAQSLHHSERSSPSDGPFVLVLTSKTPRRAHSAIRAQEELPPAHEISCASDDAHSVSRAPDAESLAPNRATSYRPSSFTPRSRSSVITRPRVFGRVLL